MEIIFDKQRLIAQLRQIVGSAVFSRGEGYFEDKLVGTIKVSKKGKADVIEAEAKVQGSRVYQTSMTFDIEANKFKQFICSCPYDWGECKHCIALGLKFADIYDDFVSRGLVFESKIENIQAVTDFFKNAGDNGKLKFEKTYEAEESDLDCGFETVADYQVTKNIDVTDGTDLSNNLTSEQKKMQRLKKLLQMIGIDASALSQEAVEELSGKMKPGHADMLERKAGKINEKISGTIFSRKYYVVLDVGYSAKIIIKSNEYLHYGYFSNEPNAILEKEKDILSPKQKELLEFLRSINYWYNEERIDWGKIFSLIRDADLRIFFNAKTDKNELKFAEDIQKITARIGLVESSGYHHDEIVKQRDFVFELLGEFYDKKTIRSLCGRESFILIKNNQIEIHPVSKKLVKILSRVLKAGQAYHDNRYYREYEKEGGLRWETELEENEIIRINEIIADARKFLNLETDFVSQFELVKFEKNREAITIDFDGLGHQLRMRATMDYGFQKIDVAGTVYKSMRGGAANLVSNNFRNREKYHIEILDDKINYARIDETGEIELFRKFHTEEQYGFGKKLRCVRKGAKQIAQFCKDSWPHICELGWEIEFLQDTLNFEVGDFHADFKVDLDAANDWLAFDVACYCGENRITLEDLKKYLKNKEEFIRTNDGRLLKISNWADLERFVMMLESFHEKESGQFEGRAYHAPELQNVFTNSPYYDAKLAKGFQKFISEAQSGKPVEKIKFPKKIKDSLRDYQKDGVSWFYFLRKYRFAGILADDMGLGKTLQALSLVTMNGVASKPSIVICPKTLLFNWEEEAKKFFPAMKVLIIEGLPGNRKKQVGRIKNYDLVVTSYSTLKKDLGLYEQKKVKFNYCFLDEAQFVKNHKTQNAQAVKKIPADYRLALTGTPLENSVSEIWSIFDFLMPGFLGNHNQFVKRFQTPIMKENNAQALGELRKKVECFMLRRTKGEVLKELPPKVEQTIVCELEEAQNILYQEILANVKSDIFNTVKEKGFAKSQIHILAGLTKLRQVCNHPTLLLKNKDHTKYESAKLDAFSELVDEIISANRKVLVFSQFTQMLDILEKELKKKDIEYLYLSGKTRKRKELVQEFNADTEKKVFLISLKAGGTGLNLTSADNVIIFDPWWNPSVENQAIDRTHRIGQKNSVNVYRLVTKGTIEERILKLQEKKKFLFDNLIGESKELFQKLTWDDVRELFK